MNFSLPYPPSTNRYWRVFRGRAVKSEEARDYLEQVQRMCGAVRPYTGPIAVVVRVYRPIKRGDLDNRIKVALDVLQGIAFVNDEQIIDLHATRHEAHTRNAARIEVFVTPRSIESESAPPTPVTAPKDWRSRATPNVVRRTSS